MEFPFYFCRLVVDANGKLFHVLNVILHIIEIISLRGIGYFKLGFTEMIKEAIIENI